MGMQAITTHVSSENWKDAAFNHWRYRTSKQKHPNGPEIGPAFSSFSMIILFFVSLKSWHLPHVYTHGSFFWYCISIGIYENHWKPCYYCSGNSKMHVARLQKAFRFLNGFVFRYSVSTSLLFTPTCGQSWQWCHRHLHSYSCTAIAKPWHMSWSLDFG